MERNNYLQQVVRAARWNAFTDSLYSTELSSVAPPDEPPIIYPEAPVWEELTNNRKRFASVDAATVPTFDGRRGHPTYWGRGTWAFLRSNEADNGARTLLRKRKLHVIEVATEYAAVLININHTDEAARFNLERYPIEAVEDLVEPGRIQCIEQRRVRLAQTDTQSVDNVDL